MPTCLLYVIRIIAHFYLSRFNILSTVETVLIIKINILSPFIYMYYIHALICLTEILECITFINYVISGSRGRDRLVVGFTTTFAISAYHHNSC
jgi:hypothetical protein